MAKAALAAKAWNRGQLQGSWTSCSPLTAEQSLGAALSTGREQAGRACASQLEGKHDTRPRLLGAVCLRSVP